VPKTRALKGCGLPNVGFILSLAFYGYNWFLGEPSLANVPPGKVFQFERLGYFVRDPDTGADGRAVFNKTIGLRDTWAKIANKG